MESQPLRFGILCRVSTIQQESKGASLDVQEQQLRDAVRTLGGVVQEVYKGQEHATENADRKILERLLQDAKNRKIDAVAVVDNSRWSRDVAQNQKDLGILRDAKVRFFISTMEQDLWDPNVLLMNAMAALFNQHQARIQVKKATDSRIQRSKEGAPASGGRLPHARRYDKKTGKWSLDEEKAAVLREQVRLVVEEKMTCVQVARRYGERISVLNKRFHGPLGDTWPQVFKSKHLPEPIIVETKIPRILDDYTISRLHEQLKANRSYDAPSRKFEYLLKGVIFDAPSGAVLAGQHVTNGKGGVWNYYRLFRNERPAMEVYNLPAKQIERAIWEQVKYALSSTKGLKDLVYEGEQIDTVRDSLLERKRTITKEEANLQVKLTGYVKRLADPDYASIESVKKAVLKEMRIIEEALQAIHSEKEAVDAKLAFVPSDQELDDARSKLRASLHDKQLDSYFSSGAALDALPFEERRKIISILFGGKDHNGVKYGIFVTPHQEKPRRYSFTAKGRFLVLTGSILSKSKQEYDVDESVAFTGGEGAGAIGKVLSESNPQLKRKVKGAGKNSLAIDSSFTSEKSRGNGPWSGSRQASSKEVGGTLSSPVRNLAAWSRLSTPCTASPLTTLASRALAAGRTSPRAPSCLARMASGRMPETGLSSPVSESSPEKNQPVTASAGMTSAAARSPMARGRS
jgi:DNA invertase Pin-like site-specific DNA recombinase